MTPKDLLDHYKEKQAIADAADVSYQAVKLWFDNDQVPLGRQFQFQIITNGALKASQSKDGQAA